jgi:hypothetical protein
MEKRKKAKKGTRGAVLRIRSVLVLIKIRIRIRPRKDRPDPNPSQFWSKTVSGIEYIYKSSQQLKKNV